MLFYRSCRKWIIDFFFYTRVKVNFEKKDNLFSYYIIQTIRKNRKPISYTKQKRE